LRIAKEKGKKESGKEDTFAYAFLSGDLRTIIHDMDCEVNVFRLGGLVLNGMDGLARLLIRAVRGRRAAPWRCG
jgi:hypothetical protein